jgi:hypothetical protein
VLFFWWMTSGHQIVIHRVRRTEYRSVHYCTYCPMLIIAVLYSLIISKGRNRGFHDAAYRIVNDFFFLFLPASFLLRTEPPGPWCTVLRVARSKNPMLLLQLVQSTITGRRTRTSRLEKGPSPSWIRRVRFSCRRYLLPTSCYPPTLGTCLGPSC